MKSIASVGILVSVNFAERTRYFSDPSVPLAIRRKLQEIMMENKAYTTEREKVSIYDQTIAKGMRLGERRGIERGRREMLLSLARDVLSDAEFDQIESITDIDAQIAEVTRLLRARK